jgi:hypothetical protein
MDYEAMVENLAKAIEEETYFTKTLPNDTVRFSTLSSETYRKLIDHIRNEKIIHHTIKSTGPSLESRNTRSTSFYFDQRNQERIKRERTPCKEHYQFQTEGH